VVVLYSIAFCAELHDGRRVLRHTALAVEDRDEEVTALDIGAVVGPHKIPIGGGGELFGLL